MERALELLGGITPERERHMRNLSSLMVPRLLYTSYEFSQLPARSVGCGGCSPHRTDCVASRSFAPPSLLKRLGPPASYLGIDLGEKGRNICGRTSYFGEDGSRDAFEGLMGVLRTRLEKGKRGSPPEPWWALPTWPLPKAWFAARAAYYKALVGTAEPLTSLLRAAPPATAYKRVLSRAVAGGRPTTMP